MQLSTKRRVVLSPEPKVIREFYQCNELVAWYEVTDSLVKVVFKRADPYTGEVREATFLESHRRPFWSCELSDFAKMYRIPEDLIMLIVKFVCRDAYLAKRLSRQY